MSNGKLLAEVIDITRDAGRLIMEHYASGNTSAQRKEDGSPVTAADRAANDRILRGLKSIAPDIPCISEESGIADYAARKDWRRFWLVDPLDGTKEFLHRNGEFTVNVALIEDGEPVLGVVYAPAMGVLYFSRKGAGSWKQAEDSAPVRIYSKPADPAQPLVVAESRSHPSPELEYFLKRFKVRKRVQAGSSLKFCLVAEGAADLYPRLGPTMEWDVAAGDCVYRDSAREGRHKTTLVYNQPTLRCAGFVIGLEGSS